MQRYNLDTHYHAMWETCTSVCVLPPDVSDEVDLQMLVTSLQRVAENNSSLLVAGDFNLPGWNWETMSLKPRAPYPAQHEWLIEKMQDMGLEQMSKEPTRIANILDLVFTNSPSLIPRIESIPGISEHDIVYFEFIVKPETRKSAVRPISLFSRANWDQMREDMSALQERYTEPVERTTEDLWLEFKTTLKTKYGGKHTLLDTKAGGFTSMDHSRHQEDDKKKRQKVQAYEKECYR